MSDVFSLSDLDAADTADMVVYNFGQPTTWVWTFAGPGHPKTIKQADRISRQSMVDENAVRQSQINGKKWKAPEVDLEQRRANNVNFIVERIVGWSPVERAPGEPFPFTEENARLVLADRRKDVFSQALDFLNGESSFMKRSAPTSKPTPSEPSSSMRSSKATAAAASD